MIIILLVWCELAFTGLQVCYNKNLLWTCILCHTLLLLVFDLFLFGWNTNGFWWWMLLLWAGPWCRWWTKVRKHNRSTSYTWYSAVCSNARSQQWVIMHLNFRKFNFWCAKYDYRKQQLRLADFHFSFLLPISRWSDFCSSRTSWRAPWTVLSICQEQGYEAFVCYCNKPIR